MQLGELSRKGEMTFSKTNKAQVWSCGGGTQSCAIAALIVKGKLPKPDVAVIADTGYETRATWEYMDAVLVPELAKVGVVLHRVKASEWNPKRCEMFWKTECRMPVYSTRFGVPSKTPNVCSSTWKGETVIKFLRSLGITRSKAVFWIGFSRDEQRRLFNMMKCQDYLKGLIRFPLVSDYPSTRREAIALVESMGWPTPPRSACWMCPNKSDNEWRLQRDERPDEFARAIALEKQIHKRDPDAWLHKSCKPLDQVDFSQPDDLFSRPCDSGQCFV